MKLKLLQLLFLTGLVPVALSLLKLTRILIREPLMWADAQNYCRRVYLHLSTVTSLKSLLLMRDFLIKLNVTEPVWMGLYNNYDSWHWSFNTHLLSNTTLRMWEINEPDNYEGHESCGGMNKNGTWHDKPCSIKNPFICYSDKIDQKYFGVTGALNWSNAQSYCRWHAKDLASPFTLEDHNLVQQVATIQGFSWIGLFRDEWRWVDGTKVGQSMWQSSLPDNADPQEYCGTLNHGQLDDKKCTKKYYFFCDSIPVVRRVVKLKVKSDESVFDPAVQAAILKLIKQKMDKKATVSWRVQPDGNVFHKKS